MNLFNFQKITNLYTKCVQINCLRIRGTQMRTPEKVRLVVSLFIKHQYSKLVQKSYRSLALRFEACVYAAGLTLGWFLDDKMHSRRVPHALKYSSAQVLLIRGSMDVPFSFAASCSSLLLWELWPVCAVMTSIELLCRESIAIGNETINRI